MLEACPKGSALCRVRGGSFCATHEASDPWVQRALAAGEPVYEVGTGRPLGIEVKDFQCENCLRWGDKCHCIPKGPHHDPLPGIEAGRDDS